MRYVLFVRWKVFPTGKLTDSDNFPHTDKEAAIDAYNVWVESDLTLDAFIVELETGHRIRSFKKGKENGHSFD